MLINQYILRLDISVDYLGVLMAILKGLDELLKVLS